ncbi:MAG: hypothetical protein HUU54_12275 [Ignavibacteriaceae bacterium]|nr:hypothetical protein [Ignavibacteriaceae bacterium]
MVALFVVLTFILFIAIDFFVLKSQGKQHPAFMSAHVFDRSSIFFPADAMLAKGHMWLKQLKDGFVRLGIDEFILKATGPFTLSTLKKEGEQVQKGEPLMVAQFGKHSVTFRSPVNGTIGNINKNLVGKKVTDPYDTDWAVSFRPIDGVNQLFSNMKSGKKATEILKDEFNRFKDFLSFHSGEPELAGVTMADGGNIVEGVLNNFNDETVSDFEKKFLDIE